MVSTQWDQLQKQIRRQHGWMLRSLRCVQARLLYTSQSQEPITVTADGLKVSLPLFISSSVFCFGVDFLPVEPRDPSHFLCVRVCVHVEIHLFNLKQQVATVTVMKSHVFTLTV